MRLLYRLVGMPSTPNVLAIGSCRIFRPLRRLHDAGLVNLVNYEDRFWFTHTAEAARQYVDVMQGRVHIPQELRPAALESDLEWPEDMALGLPDADLVIAEVSSLKGPSVGEFKLNAHKVYGIAKESGLDSQPITHGNTAALPDDHILKTLKVAYTTSGQIRDDLRAIKDATGAPMMVVDHLYAMTSEGELIPGRAPLTIELKEASKDVGYLFHSTRDLIEEHGAETALLDHNHYRAEFEATVGESMLPSIIAAAGQYNVGMPTLNESVTCPCGWTFNLPDRAAELAEHDCPSDQFHNSP